MNTLTRKILVAGALIAAATTASAQAVDNNAAPPSDDTSVSAPAADQPNILLLDDSDGHWIPNATAADQPTVLLLVPIEDQGTSPQDADSSASAPDADQGTPSSP